MEGKIARMKKWVTKKNGIVLILLFVFTIGVITFQKPIYDVEITINVPEGTSNGGVVQLFWDAGSGYNAENSCLVEIVNTTGTLSLPKEIVENIVAYRLDPIHCEQDIVYESIYVNEEELPASDFFNYIGSAVQTEVYLEEFQNNNGEQLRFDVQGNDSQLYLNETFKEYMIQAARLSGEEKATMISIATIIALVIIFYKEILQAISFFVEKAERVSEQVLNIQPKWRTLILIIAIGAVAFIVMNQYIIGDKRFLFTDASDSYFQTYPSLVSAAKYIEKGLVYDAFNFSKGIGTSQGMIKLSLTNWVSWFGEDAVAYLMGFSQLLKMFLSGVCFYGFLRIKGTERWYSVILSLGYAFCGHMAVRAAWSSYPNEVLLVAVWLLAFECWFQRKDFRWLPIATFLIFYHYNSGYHYILYLLFLPAYVLFRYITERKIKWKTVGISILGMGIAVVVYLYATKFSVFNQIFTALQSDRVREVLGKTDWSVSNLALDFDLLPRIFGRTVGLSVLGIIRNNYVEEYWNFLEDPTFFCGITVLLLIPIAFYSMKWKQRVLYFMVYVVGLVYCLSEPLRTVVNGFSGVTFKQSSFWIILIMLATVSHIDFRKLKAEQKGKICFTLLSVTTVLLWAATYALPNIIECSESEWKYALIFILLEYICFGIYLLRDDVTYLMKCVLVLLVCVETICVSYPVYNNRSTDDGSSYEDETLSALEEIAEREGDSFYRVDKQFISVDSCDAMVQDYYGTAFYIGGTGIDGRIANFYSDLGLPIYSMNRRSWGISGYNDAQNILGIKYALTDLDYVGHYGYTKVGEVDGISIYENEYAMPMGFVYQYAIERSTFEKLNNKQRQQILYKACLVEDGLATIPLLDEESLSEVDRSQQLFDKYEITYEPLNDNEFMIETSTEDEVIVVSATFNKSGSAYLYYDTEDGKEGTMRIQKEIEPTGQIFEIVVSDVNSIGFTSAGITDLRIAKIPKEEYYADFERDMGKLKESAVKVTHFEDNLIEGEFYTEEAGILYLTLPSPNWQIYIDGEKQDNHIVNDAFLGINVEAGSHSLRAVYVTLNFDILYGKDVKMLMGCFAIFIGGTIWMHKKRKRGMINEGNISSSTSI